MKQTFETCIFGSAVTKCCSHRFNEGTPRKKCDCANCEAFDYVPETEEGL